jgi:hypothetical protein
MFYICLTDVKILPQDVLRKIETCTSFDRLHVNIYIILTYIAFVGIKELFISDSGITVQYSVAS